MKKLKIILLTCVLTSCVARIPLPESPVSPAEQKKETKPVLREVAIIVLTSVFRAILR